MQRSLSKKERGKKWGEISGMPVVAAASAVNAKATVAFSVVGPLDLPIPFTLSFKDNIANLKKFEDRADEVYF